MCSGSKPGRCSAGMGSITRRSPPPDWSTPERAIPPRSQRLLAGGAVCYPERRQVTPQSGREPVRAIAGARRKDEKGSTSARGQGHACLVDRSRCDRPRCPRRDGESSGRISGSSLSSTGTRSAAAEAGSRLSSTPSWNGGPCAHPRPCVRAFDSPCAQRRRPRGTTRASPPSPGSPRRCGESPKTREPAPTLPTSPPCWAGLAPANRVRRSRSRQIGCGCRSTSSGPSPSPCCTRARRSGSCRPAPRHDRAPSALTGESGQPSDRGAVGVGAREP